MIWGSWLIGITIGVVIYNIVRRWPRAYVPDGSLCGQCEYSLTGLGNEGRCPECGQPFTRPLVTRPSLRGPFPRVLFFRRAPTVLHARLINLPLIIPIVLTVALVLAAQSSTATPGDYIAGFVFALPFIASPFVVLAMFGHSVRYRCNQGAFAALMLAGLFVVVVSLAFAAYTMFRWPDAQSALMVIFGPILATGWLGYGLLLGWLIARKLSFSRK
ncbi:MAG TPA: hypothetical protein VG797_09475 [Phycisphaerales bacterium]|nr:hypothetical protein [Phycisphaerales bacterium]